MRLRRLDFPAKRHLPALYLYLAAAVLYVAIGVAFPDFLLGWWTAALYLIAVVALVPAVVRRLR